MTNEVCLKIFVSLEILKFEMFFGFENVQISKNKNPMLGSVNTFHIISNEVKALLIIVGNER